MTSTLAAMNASAQYALRFGKPLQLNVRLVQRFVKNLGRVILMT
jgi:hypothetical protein